MDRPTSWTSLFFFLWVWCDMSQVGLASTAANRRRCMVRTRKGHGGNGQRGPTRPNILPWIIPTSEGDARFTTSPCRLVREKPLPPWFLSLGKSVCVYIYSLSLWGRSKPNDPSFALHNFAKEGKPCPFLRVGKWGEVSWTSLSWPTSTSKTLSLGPPPRLRAFPWWPFPLRLVHGKVFRSF